MKVKIEVEFLEVDSSAVFAAESYPCDGMYIVEDQYGVIYQIEVFNGCATGSMIQKKPVFINEEATDQDFILKVIAIVGDPKMAKDLVNRKG